MRILLTGASSFSGFWFATKLAARGATVVAPLAGGIETGAARRDARVAKLLEFAEVTPEAPFGAPGFLDLLDAPYDALCLHGAAVGDFRNPDYDVAAALGASTRNAGEVFRRFAAAGGRKVVVTGSAFEPGEGGGAEAVSAYGLAKGFAWSVLARRAAELGLVASKYVIANPFGPWEEARLCDYLARAWLAGETPELRAPRYVRDNAPVDLLAHDYAEFVAACVTADAPMRRAPSWWVESVLAFAERLGRGLGPHLGTPTPVRSGVQTQFDEPLARVNADPILPAPGAWDEAAFWRDYARHLLALHAPNQAR